MSCLHRSTSLALPSIVGLALGASCSDGGQAGAEGAATSTSAATSASSNAVDSESLDGEQDTGSNEPEDTAAGSSTAEAASDETAFDGSQNAGGAGGGPGGGDLGGDDMSAEEAAGGSAMEDAPEAEPTPEPTEGERPAARPSPGCGNANPATGSASEPLNDGKPYYVKLPADYDPNTPYRALFVFNPTGNPIDWAENNAGYERLSAQDTAIRVYPHQNPNDLSRSPGGWNGGDVPSFEPLYNAIMDSFCVDQARVFAAGESSGGDFVSVLGCEYGDKLRAVAPCATKPVGGYPLDPGRRNCVGDVTSIVMHGLNDNVVGPENGPATRDFYAEVNECGGATVPVDGYTDDQSNCVMFTDCKDDYPVYWCQHQDPNYSGTQHGWPRFAAQMTWDIFEGY